MALDTTLIAPCGMNCGICLAYLRKERKCPGCRGDDSNKPPTRLKCVIKNCEIINKNQAGFCYECKYYPCKRLQQLDKRYRAKYRMSMIENLDYIQNNGISAFVEKEEKRWRCPECGGFICVHRGYCLDCRDRVI
jgi:hypothetical protein